MSQVTTYIIDDADLRVRYPEASNFGWREGGDPWTEFMGTTHVTLTKGDAVSLSFNGTRVGMYGTVREGRGLAPIQCVLDGTEIPTTPHDVVNGTLSHHVQFCAGDVPDDQEHTFVATLLEQDDSDNDTFILDYFTYDVPVGSSRSGVPSGSNAAQNQSSFIVIDDRDTERVKYEGSWAEKTGGYGKTADGYAAGTTVTTTVGSKAVFRFAGRGVQVFGATETDASWDATFQITSKPDTELGGDQGINVSTRRRATDFIINQPYAHTRIYASPSLPVGEYVLTVEYTGGPQELALNYLVYEAAGGLTGDSSERKADGGSGEEGDGDGSPSDPGWGGRDKPKIIAGIVVAAVLVSTLLLCVAVLLWKARKARRKRHALHATSPFYSADYFALQTPRMISNEHSHSRQTSLTPQFEMTGVPDWSAAATRGSSSMITPRDDSPEVGALESPEDTASVTSPPPPYRKGRD